MSGPSGVVFDIQHYAVHDGPGIRTLVFFKGCPLACPWCCNPESRRPAPEPRWIEGRCQSAFRCQAACPHGAVTTVADTPVLDRSRCATCLTMPCVRACCSQALTSWGVWMDAGAVVDRVAADVEFYRNSGGGVTCSGGEPFAQPEFLRAVLQGCRAHGIHTAVETCGQTSRDALLATEPFVDLFLFDLKLADSVRHRAATGVDNRLILANLEVLSRVAADRIVITIPIVPGYTDDDANLRGLAALAGNLGIRRVECRVYHPYGHEKYAQLGRLPPPVLSAVTPETVDRAREAFRAVGQEVQVG